MTTLAFIADPGHGWLRVPLDSLATLDMTPSHYSFVDTKKGLAYLEEDCDAPAYIRALKATGKTLPHIPELNQNNFSNIRKLPRFTRK